MKINKNCFELLLEAYRRQEIFERNNDRHELMKPLGDRWLGLGTQSAYQLGFDAGLFRWIASIPQKRCMGWVALTPKGVEAFNELLPELKAEFQQRTRPGYITSILGNYQLSGGLRT